MPLNFANHINTYPCIVNTNALNCSALGGGVVVKYLSVESLGFSLLLKYHDSMKHYRAVVSVSVGDFLVSSLLASACQKLSVICCTMAYSFFNR